MKKTLYIDLDSTLVDFESGISRLSASVRREYDGRLDEVPGIFSLMVPLPDAVDAFQELSRLFDTYILSTAPWNNPSAWSDKLLWVQQHLGAAAHKRLILSHHKHLNTGDYLVDDRPNNGAAQFTGTWLPFGPEHGRFPDWNTMLPHLRALA